VDTNFNQHIWKHPRNVPTNIINTKKIKNGYKLAIRMRTEFNQISAKRIAAINVEKN